MATVSPVHRNRIATSMSLPIEQLIERDLPAAQRGDRDAFGRIVTACQNTVTAIALAITRDVAGSEDIAQDAFVAAWQHLKRLQNPASFLPWLRQITRNLARDHLRAGRHRPLDGDGAAIAIALAADPEPTPQQSLLDDEREAIAAELIGELPADSRELLLLYYREDQSSKQVAALLGLSDSAVRKRLSRARQGLQDELLARFGSFARSTAPGAAFASVVSAALVLASPPAAAKTLLTIGTTAGAKTIGKVLLGAAGSLGIAMVAAFAGIFLGLRRQLRGAIDETERRALIRSAVINALASIGFLIAMLVLATRSQGWLLPVIATLLFMAVIFYQTGVVQPRALRRRHALEAQRDPIAAARQRRRERVMCWVGATIGTLGAIGGLIGGLVSSGRL